MKTEKPGMFMNLVTMTVQLDWLKRTTRPTVRKLKISKMIVIKEKLIFEN